MKRTINLGLDIGSTTIKLIVLDKNGNILFKKYRDISLI